MGQRVSPESAVPLTAEVKAAIASNPRITHMPQIAAASKIAALPPLPEAGLDAEGHLKKGASQSFLGDIAISPVPGKEMVAGFYHEKAGPTLHYTYSYEEFKYI